MNHEAKIKCQQLLIIADFRVKQAKFYSLKEAGEGGGGGLLEKCLAKIIKRVPLTPAGPFWPPAIVCKQFGLVWLVGLVQS